MAKQSQKTDTAPQTEEKGSTFAQILYDWLSTLFLAVVVILLVMTFFVRQVTVKGNSMNDTLQTQDRLLVSSFLYHPQNGDIVRTVILSLLRMGMSMTMRSSSV